MLKITREEQKSLEAFHRHNKDIERAIEYFVKYRQEFTDLFKPLKRFSILEFIDLLQGNYEIVSVIESAIIELRGAVVFLKGDKYVRKDGYSVTVGSDYDTDIHKQALDSGHISVFYPVEKSIKEGY